MDKWSNHIKELKAVGILLIMTTAAICFLLVSAYLIDSLAELGVWGPSIGIVSLLFISIAANFLHKKIPNRLTNIIALIFSLPIGIVLILFNLFFPVIIIFMTIGLTGVILIFPTFSFFKILDFFNLYFLKPEFQTYIQFSLSFILLLLFNVQIKKILIYLIAVNENMKRWMEEYKYRAIIDYIFNLKNIRFFIYSFYLVFFIYYSLEFVGKLNNVPSGKENAILQSFLTFLAFDQLIPILKKARLKPSVILLMVKESIKLSFNDKISSSVDESSQIGKSTDIETNKENTDKLND